jgi:hypothetical protein
MYIRPIIHLNYLTMSNVKFLQQLRKQMEQLQAEYNALSEAYKLLSQAKTGRGRKPSLNFLSTLTETGTPAKRTGKRGRPPGAKNKPGYKKPGPKPIVEAKAPAKKGAKAAARKNN